MDLKTSKLAVYGNTPMSTFSPAPLRCFVRENIKTKAPKTIWTVENFSMSRTKRPCQEKFGVKPLLFFKKTWH